MEGYVQKRKKLQFVSNWNRRYFILRDGLLKSFVSHVVSYLFVFFLKFLCFLFSNFRINNLKLFGLFLILKFHLDHHKVQNFVLLLMSLLKKNVLIQSHWVHKAKLMIG